MNSATPLHRSRARIAISHRTRGCSLLNVAPTVDAKTCESNACPSPSPRAKSPARIAATVSLLRSLRDSAEPTLPLRE